MRMIPQTTAQIPMIQMMVTRPVSGQISNRMPNRIDSAPPMMPQTHPLLGTARCRTDDMIWRMPVMMAQTPTMIKDRKAHARPDENKDPEEDADGAQHDTKHHRGRPSLPDRLDDVEDADHYGIGADHDRQRDCCGDRGEESDQAENDCENSADNGEDPDLLGQAGKVGLSGRLLIRSRGLCQPGRVHHFADEFFKDIFEGDHGVGLAAVVDEAGEV
jgi:hypothetical protein